MVELGRIELPSARWLPNPIRPFPHCTITASAPVGQLPEGHRKVFPYSQHSFWLSAVFPCGPPPLLLPGCGDPAPCAITGHYFPLAS